MQQFGYPFETAAAITLFSEGQHSQHQPCNHTDNTHAPNPEEAALDMVLDLHPGQSYAQEGGRHYRADEGGAVAAHHHGDRRMGRVNAELIANTDKHRKKAVKIRIGTEEKGQRHGQNTNNQRQRAVLRR